MYPYIDRVRHHAIRSCEHVGGDTIYFFAKNADRFPCLEGPEGFSFGFAAAGGLLSVFLAGAFSCSAFALSTLALALGLGLVSFFTSSGPSSSAV
ncbi:unnamed protein product, partial [Mycena citricolor]